MQDARGATDGTDGSRTGWRTPAPGSGAAEQAAARGADAPATDRPTPDGGGDRPRADWQPTMAVEPQPRSRTPLILGVAGVVVLLGAVAFGALRLPPSTTLAGETIADVGGAEDALAPADEALAGLDVRFTTAAGSVVEVAGADLGLDVDPDASTADLARGLPSLERWAERIAGGPVAEAVRIRPLEPARLAELADELTVPATEPDVAVRSGGIAVREGADGTEVTSSDVDQALDEALATIGVQAPTSWPAVLEVDVEGVALPPSVVQADIDALEEELAAFESSSVQLTASVPPPVAEEEEQAEEDGGTAVADPPRVDETIALTAEELRGLVAVEQVEGAGDGERLRLAPDPVLRSPRLDDLLDRAVVDPELTAQVENRSPTPERDDDLTDVDSITGDLVVEDAEAGFAPDIEATLREVIDVGLAGGGEVEVIGQEDPTVTPEDLGIVEPISTFTTFYTPGQSRNTNIQRIAEIVDGTIIPPGTSYELNHAVGRRTRDRGFVEGGAILDGELVSDVGGGVSQFATTFFNAAWFGGVELVDWKAHSFYFSRYPAGREATINFPNVNLEIFNDTPHAILVDTDTDDSSVTVTFWSTPYWDVQTVTGPCACGGSFSITVDRIRTAPGEAPIEESWTTFYTVPQD